MTRNGRFVLAMVLMASPALGAETGKLVVAEPLKAEPFRDAKNLAQRASGDGLQILKRQGGWYQVKSGKGNGWVRMLSVRRADVKKASAASEASGLLALASGRAGTGAVVATTGIRGLDEEQLKSAAFSESALAESDGHVKSAAEAAAFAARGKLVARKLDYLPEPVREEAARD